MKALFVVLLTTIGAQSIVILMKEMADLYLATRCIEQASLQAYNFTQGKKNVHTQFLVTYMITESLSLQGLKIQDRILKQFHKHSLWTMEIFQNQRLNFEPFTENCGEEEHLGSCIKRPVMPFKTRLYIMTFESLDVLHEKMDLVAETSTFSRDALFILYYPKGGSSNQATVEEIFSILYDYSVRYMVVMIPRNQSLIECFVVRNNFHKERPCFSRLSYRIFTAAICSHANGFKMLTHESTNIFDKLNPKNYKQCTMNVFALPNQPFVVSNESGLEVDMIHEIIGKVFNISFLISLYQNDTLELGEKRDDGTWTGFLEPVFSEWYLGIGNIPPEPKLTKDFTYSVAYRWNQNVYVVPIAALVPSWRVLMAIFTVEMWGVTLAAILGFAIACYVFKTKTEIAAFRTLGRSVLVTFQIIIAHPTGKLPKTKFTRVFFVGMASLGIILNCVYNCSLIFFLQNPVREHQISSQEEIVNHNLLVGGSPKYKEMFQSEDSKSILDSFQTVDEDLDSSSYWLRKVANQRNISTIGVKTNLLYMLSHNNPLVADRHGRPKVFILEKPLRAQPVGILMRRGHFIEGPVNFVVQRLLLEGGMFGHIAKKYITGKSGAVSAEDESDEEERAVDTTDVSPLSNHNLEGAYVLYGIGLGCGCIVFVLELLYVYCCKK